MGGSRQSGRPSVCMDDGPRVSRLPAKPQEREEASWTRNSSRSCSCSQGGVKVYEAALKCARNEELREEWERYSKETETHVRILQDVLTGLGLDPNEKSTGREIVREIGASLVKAMEKARAAGDPAAAQIVACECVVFAETKDH